MNSVAAALVLGLALALAACNGSSATASAPGPAVADLGQLRAEAEQRLAERDWPLALAAYRRALAQAPDDLHLRYGLGVAAAHLDRRDEAIAAFRWVVERGAADLEPVRVARQWLVEAGVVPATAPSTTTAAGPVAPGGGTVQGRTEWPAVEAQRPRRRLQVLLEGDDLATRGRRYGARVLLNDPYRIAGVAPGRYRLMAQVGSTRLWDTRITVQDGAPTTVDLTADASVAPGDALRPVRD